MSAGKIATPPTEMQRSKVSTSSGVTAPADGDAVAAREVAVGVGFVEQLADRVGLVGRVLERDARAGRQRGHELADARRGRPRRRSERTRGS